MINLHAPLQSLKEGRWFKLICGASFQHLPSVRNLVLAYALAGADCIDVAADPAIVTVAREALAVVPRLHSAAREQGIEISTRPWLMVSLNDGEDPHFRKAAFEPTQCPPDCPRPCERICPTQAIVFERPSDGFSGVLDSRCYGCGRCLAVCPLERIYARSHVTEPAVAVASVLQMEVDAIEIHTQVGRLDDFRRLWGAIAPWLSQLKLIAISCPDGSGLLDYLWSLHDLISPLPCPLIWQTDGRPMSGDIGGGTARASLKLAQKVLAAGPPGHVQLAGGTNARTVPLLKANGLLSPPASLSISQLFAQNPPWSPSMLQSEKYVSGVAYGSYARTLLSSILTQLDDLDPETAQITVASDRDPQIACLEAHAGLLWEAVHLARNLISPLKSVERPQPSSFSG